MSHHKETKTYTSPDEYYSSSSGNIPQSFEEFTSNFHEDPFSVDFIKKYIENNGALPSVDIMSHHKETKTYTTTCSCGNIPQSFEEFTSNFHEDPFSDDFIKKCIENSGALLSVDIISHRKEAKTYNSPDGTTTCSCGNILKSNSSNFHEGSFSDYLPTEQVGDGTGCKRAVLVGINYNNTEYQLRGKYFFF
jgi:hypothetical protein